MPPPVVSSEPFHTLPGCLVSWGAVCMCGGAGKTAPTPRRQYWASWEQCPIAHHLARLDPDPGFPEEVRRQELMAGHRRPRPTRSTPRSSEWGVWRPRRLQLQPV